MQLLPRHHSTVSPTHGTKWRDWMPDARRTPSVQEYINATNEILARLLSDAQINSTRWCNLIKSAGGMTPEQREIFLQRLAATDPTSFSAKESVQIWHCLREETIHHRDFPASDWAMPTDSVQRMEEVCTCFEPDEPIARHDWLFSYNVKLPGMLTVPWNKGEEAVERLRTEALQHILKSQGWKGILSLVEQVKEPALVGITLGHSDLLPIDLGEFLQNNLGAPEHWRNQMAYSFVSFCAHNRGDSWIEDCLLANSKTWNPEQYGNFLLCLPFSTSLLDRIDALSEEIQRYFWSHIRHISFFNAIYIDRLLNRLIEFERPHLAVVSALPWAIKQAPEIVSSERIAKILEISVQIPPGVGFDTQSFVYRSAELLDHLENSDLTQDRLAQLEWMYFKIHSDYRHPRILHEELAQNPDFFIEVLRCLYRAENEPQVEQTEEAIAFAHLVYELLDSWHKMPGVQADGSVDAEALYQWVRRVRELATACDRSKFADVRIGHILAFSPLDPDGAWPHTAVRNLMEELTNPVIERNLSTQKLNNRGTTTRLATDGGAQEQVLVERYENWAIQIGDQWPKAAAMLREMADGYRRQAVQEDQYAEMTQDFWR
jgi:hypothetical protein